MPDKLIEIFVSVFGAIVGSFLNVCIHRMPNIDEAGYSLIRPSSHCPHCKKNILWYDNIPILGFIFLRGRCRFCQEKISIRYPIVELLTALIFLVIFRRFDLSWDSLIYNVFACGLVIATFIDIKWRIIPDELSVGGTVVGLLIALSRSFNFSPFAFHYPVILDSLIGAIVGGGLIYGSGIMGNLIFFKLMKKESIEGETESMGGGDVKLMAAIGSFLGWKLVVLTFFVAPFLGAAFGIYILTCKKSHLIPYGPFLSLAAFISLFYGDAIIRFWIFRY